MPSYRIHERFLRHMWLHAAVSSLRLLTTDGRAVVVENSGRLNPDAGPDVSNARVRVGDAVYVGHVEIHRTVDEWRLHGHDSDPAYNAVVLHVLLEPPGPGKTTRTLSGRTVPMLVLAGNVDESVRATWERAIHDERRTRLSRIRCADENSDVPLSTLREWLDHVELERLEIKLRRFEERLRELAFRRLLVIRDSADESSDRVDEGSPDEVPPPYPELTRFDLARRDIWEQVLYEGFLEGLGYSKNRRPFIRLGQSLTLDVVRQLTTDTVQREALFFGVAGLLPRSADVEEHESRLYAEFLNQEWSKLTELYRGERLTSTDWVLAPTRPHNAPLLRLVAAQRISSGILRGDFFRWIIDALRTTNPVSEFRICLHRLLHLEPGPFWENRLSFERTSKAPVRLLGSARKDDLIVNTVLPLGLLYSRVFRQPGLRSNVLRLLAEYPPTESNWITRRMERELIRGRITVRSAGRQQALVQLFNYYCTDERCRECAVGRWVWGEHNSR